jgi:hypothetical protein
MDQWLSNLSPFENLPNCRSCGIILLLEPRKRNDAETLVAIRKALEKAGAESGDGER